MHQVWKTTWCGQFPFQTYLKTGLSRLMIYYNKYRPNSSLFFSLHSNQKGNQNKLDKEPNKNKFTPILPSSHILLKTHKLHWSNFISTALLKSLAVFLIHIPTRTVLTKQCEIQTSFLLIKIPLLTPLIWRFASTVSGVVTQKLKSSFAFQPNTKTADITDLHPLNQRKRKYSIKWAASVAVE